MAAHNTFDSKHGRKPAGSPHRIASFKSKMFTCLSLLAVVLTSCDDTKELTLSRAELLNPETCRNCHVAQFNEWQKSMHAYAADDPLFLAMNARGQRETNGELGDFCVQCHAPMAVREGLTEDGLNLGSIPQEFKGVTCYFCHNVEAVEGTHNNPLALANDVTMRGAIRDPIKSQVHRSQYSELLDRESDASADLCGSCHDIVAPTGAHIERTYTEWQDSVFNTGQFNQTCGECHMPAETALVANVPEAPLREKGRHSHLFPAVDIPITPWPGIDQLREANNREHENAVASKVCYNPQGNTIDVFLTNIGSGHNFPSGSAPDRRGWLELVAVTDGAVVFESGTNTEGIAISELDDPNLWNMRDFWERADGKEAHMFWEAETLVDSPLLPPATTFDVTNPNFDHSVLRQYPLGAIGRPDEITVQVRLRPFGFDIIDDLVSTGDASPDLKDAIETFDYSGSRLVWTPALAGADGCVDPPNAR